MSVIWRTDTDFILCDWDHTSKKKWSSFYCKKCNIREDLDFTLAVKDFAAAINHHLFLHHRQLTLW